MYQSPRRIAELRNRRWGRFHGSSNSGDSSDLEMSLRSDSLTSSTTTTTTATTCETYPLDSGSSSDVSSHYETPPFPSIYSSDHQVLLQHDPVYSHRGRRNKPSPLPCRSNSPNPGANPRSPRSPLQSPRSPASPNAGGGRCTGGGPPSPSSYYRSHGNSGGNLARLASRRSSRDSEAGEPSPLNCSRYGQRRTSNFLEIPEPTQFRHRVCSLPEQPYNPRNNSEDIYRLRSFSITNKGVVNCGDAFISRRSRSNTSINSTLTALSSRSRSGDHSPFGQSCCGSSYNVSSEESINIRKHRIMLLGGSGVGKTALVSQFMTSEYMNTYDASLDDEFGEKSVSVLLDGEESELVFIDHPSAEMSVENCLTTYDPHAFILVYSITDRASFHWAQDTLRYLSRDASAREKAVIVVGNKSDLARSRVIKPEEGKRFASEHDSKFIEASSGIQHNVDELLVGILKQIRLRQELVEKKKRKNKGNLGSTPTGSRTTLSLSIARDILNKLCLQDSKSKSCENLLVL